MLHIVNAERHSKRLMNMSDVHAYLYDEQNICISTLVSVPMVNVKYFHFLMARAM